MTDATSPLAALTGAGRTDVIPGYTLSPWTLRDYGELESEFNRAYIADAAAASANLPPELADKLLVKALEDVRAGCFNWGRTTFTLKMLSATSLPVLLYMSLRNSQPNVTRAEAASLVDLTNARRVHAAILELEGYGGRTKKNEAAGATVATSPNAGTPSSPPSESADSVTTKSSA